MLEKELYLENFNTDDFILQFQKIDDKKEIYQVNLDHNIKMPKEYSEIAIDEVFNKSIISEDKLEIEYLLLSIVVLNDILEGNFKYTYVVEFKTTLFSKNSKIDRILEKIDNQALQDKIYLKIKYEELSLYKDKVIEYTKDGYKFAIELDNSMKNKNEIEKLKMFKTILVPKNFQFKDEIINKEFEFDNNFIVL